MAIDDAGCGPDAAAGRAVGLRHRSAVRAGSGSTGPRRGRRCARSPATVEAAESLDITGSCGDEVFSLRYILTRVIEEYARHNGRAHPLRERVDGTTGEQPERAYAGSP